MKFRSAFTAVLFFSCCFPWLTPASAADPIRALLVTGGCCHDYMTQKHVVTSAISARCKTPITWTIVQYDGQDGRVPVYGEENWGSKFDIVFHNECHAGVKDMDWIEKILKPHRDGLAAVVMHCTMHSYNFGRVEPWVQFLGVRSHGHGKHYAYTVEPIKTEHEILADLQKPWTTPKGELYHVAEVMPTAVPLARAKRQEGDGEIYDVCLWTNTFGKGRVFGTTVGHHNETVEHPIWLDTVTRGFLWAINRSGDFKSTDPAELQKITEKARQTAEAEKNKPKPADPSAQIAASLATGKTASASSAESSKNNFARNGNDGNLQTRWCANGGGSGEWWQTDLGAEQKISGFRIHWEKPGATYTYRVEGSTDGQNWNILAKASEKSESSVFEHSFDPVAARHLRVVFEGADGGLWGSFWEFEAFAGKIPPLTKSGLKNEMDPSTLLGSVKAPDAFDVTLFGKPPEISYPVCLTAAPTGEVFVGVDENGSLGKVEGYGKVLRCVDTDGDGKADDLKVFAKMRHPRGLFWNDGTLWVLHPPFLTRYRDTNGDGVADEEKVLLKGISTEKHVYGRGADHTTNGITVGIDGWIYIAVGDFGYHKAVDAEGREHQLLGGGIARVRPDGTELEVYARGLRNVCDVAIDPFLNQFTRDNTNDGGGWDVRLSHIAQGAHYGYPSLYKSFSDELVAPLADYGGGSGTGALYMDEPLLPAAYRRALLTADWGRSMVYFHPVNAKGASFTAQQQEFLRLDRVTDMAVDGSGRLYAASWKDGGFSYSNPNVGFVVRLTAKDWKFQPFPDLKQAGDQDLLTHLRSDSHVRRLHTQLEILKRGDKPVFREGLEALATGDAILEAKVAAIFTLKQLLGAKSADLLVKISAKPDVREFALRALADRSRENASVPLEPFLKGLGDADPRVRTAALTALGRLGRSEAGASMVRLTADADPLVAHAAFRALAELKAFDACLKAIGNQATPVALGALRALRQMHETAAVDGLILKIESASDAALKKELFTTLIRLHDTEGEWPGDWWGTRPDTYGPYYRRAAWSETEKIDRFLAAQLPAASKDIAEHITDQLVRHKVKTGAGGAGVTAGGSKDPKVNLDQVLKDQAANVNKGVGAMGFDEAVAAINKAAGDAKLGQELYLKQGCIACHTITAGEPPRGPMLLDISKRYNRQQLIQSILQPNAVIAQGFATTIFSMKDGSQQMGFVTAEGAEEVEIRTIAGQSFTLIKKQIQSRQELDRSMMPDGLVAALKPQELASLIAYLETLKSN